MWMRQWLACTCVCFCTCVLESVCLCVCLCVGLLSCLCEIYCVGVCGEGKYQYVTGLFFFSPLLSLLSHLHYTPISLGWIKSAIKTSVHVSVKDMRHINSTHTMSTLVSRGGFYSIYISSACCFVVCIFRCACLFSHTCIHAFVYVKRTEM